MKRLLLLLWLVVPLAASARIGETREQCEKRYGQPVKTLDDQAVIFQKDNVEITTYFDSSNRVEYIEYRAPDLGSKVIAHLLQVSAAEEWVPLSDNSYHADAAKRTAIVTHRQSVRIYLDGWEVRKAEMDRRRLRSLPKPKLDGL